MALLKTYGQLLLLYLFSFRSCPAAEVTTRDKLYEHIFEDYNNKGFPVINYTDQVKIGIACYLVSINQFKEISGELSLAMYFRLAWVEERLYWNETEFDGLGSILVSPDDIWRPRFFVIQSSDRIQEIGNISVFLRLYSNGYVYWTPADEFKLSCSVDVTYFPFDRQLCVIEFSGLVYDMSELILYAANSNLDTNQMTNNSQWAVLPSDVRNCTMDRGSSCIEIHLSLKRKSEFYIVYIFVPLSFLGILNNLVFVMPANSGERNSVAVTTFLSFVVYMGIVNDVVPQSSSPLSYLYMYLMFLMVYSSTIMFLCIISLRLYNGHGKVNCLIKCIVILLRCRCFRYCKWSRVKRMTNSIPKRINKLKMGFKGKCESTERNHNNASKYEEGIELDTENKTETEIDQSKNHEGEGRKDPLEITWFHVGRTFDIFWVLVLYMLYFAGSAYTFIVLYFNINLETNAIHNITSTF